MNRLFPGGGHATEEILALRRAIARLADECRIDLGDRTAVRRFMDDGQPGEHLPQAEREARRELREMVTLLLRIEACSSEDIGIVGLRRLWSQHREILARFQIREAMRQRVHHELSA